MKLLVRDVGNLENFNKIMKVIKNIFFGISIMIAILLVFSLVKGKIQGQIPSVAGYRMYIVSSGSMSPAFDTGSLVVVKPEKPAVIEEGDVITFKGAGGNENLTSHRVVKRNHTVDGLTFTTKGDANDVIDPSPILADRLVGKIVLAIPYLGYLMDFIRTREGVLVFILIPIILLILCEIRKVYKNKS